jgi:ribosomal protein S18 acetylase RimI-like enzyme
MSIQKAAAGDVEGIAPLIAKFRVELKSYKRITACEDIAAAKAEFFEHIDAGYPIYIFMRDNLCLGYLVCRVEEPVVWVEALHVSKEYRRAGIASALFQMAEELAASYGEETLFNYVHPNNDGMIAFLRKNGYDTLNLIEIRKRYAGEIIHEQIKIGNNLFSY